jgi:hypothetical protein
MADLLDPDLKENKLGGAEVRQVFPLAKGFVAGCLVTEGKINRNASARLSPRQGIVHEGKIGTLQAASRTMPTRCAPASSAASSSTIQWLPGRRRHRGVSRSRRSAPRSELGITPCRPRFHPARHPTDEQPHLRVNELLQREISDASCASTTRARRWRSPSPERARLTGPARRPGGGVGPGRRGGGVLANALAPSPAPAIREELGRSNRHQGTCRSSSLRAGQPWAAPAPAAVLDDAASEKPTAETPVSSREPLYPEIRRRFAVLAATRGRRRLRYRSCPARWRLHRFASGALPGAAAPQGMDACA